MHTQVTVEILLLRSGLRYLKIEIVSFVLDSCTETTDVVETEDVVSVVSFISGLGQHIGPKSEN